jgi:hypothetical protein
MILLRATETIEVLRLTLQQIQAELHPELGAESTAELERIILRRISELELALESRIAPIATFPIPAPTQSQADEAVIVRRTRSDSQAF